MMKVLVALALCVAVVAAASFDHPVTSLSAYQDASGGFAAAPGSPPSARATAAALTLSSLYGQRGAIRSYDVKRFVETLENSDFGFGPRPGVSSDVHSTLSALIAFHSLGAAVPNEENVANYVLSLFDADAGLFRDRAGSPPSVTATATALRALSYLGQLKSFSGKSAVAASLGALVKDGSHFEGADNAAGIMAGTLVGMKFGDKSAWREYIGAQQQASGGFGSIVESADLFAAYKALGEGAGDDSVDVMALIYGLSGARHDLVSASASHEALARTGAPFVGSFDTTIGYEVLDSAQVRDTIVQGTQLKPTVRVTSAAGAVHAGLNVEATAAFPSGRKVGPLALRWKNNAGVYTTDEYLGTDGELGEVTFSFTMKSSVKDVATSQWAVSDSKSIGFGVDIDAKVTHLGRSVAPGDSVGNGAEFAFSLRLYNHSHADLRTGAFDVLFTVLDSSDLAIKSDKLSGGSKGGPISFAYTLNDNSIPSGALTFQFSAASKSGVVHTTARRSYALSVPMVATQIQTGAASYKLGDSVTVSMEPANYVNLRDVHNLKSDAAFQGRSFEMVVSTPSGAVINTVSGTPSKGSKGVKYTFATTVPTTLASLGENVLSFYYVPVGGSPVALENFDSKTNDLLDETEERLHFSVAADLVASVSKKPGASDYHFGNSLTYKIDVEDKLSGVAISSDNSEAGVYLVLTQASGSGKDTESARVQASGSDGTFTINWTISPNAAKGAGVVKIVAINANGDVSPLVLEGTTKPLEYNVDVGGEITVTHEVYTTPNDDSVDSVFVVEASLFSEGKRLHGADLSCEVVGPSGSFPAVVASTSDEATYLVSFKASHENLPSGSYNLQFFREVDVVAAQQAADFEAKAAAKAAALGQKASAASAVDVSPLFEITVDHAGAENTNSLIASQYVAIIGFVALFGYASVTLGKISA